MGSSGGSSCGSSWEVQGKFRREFVESLRGVQERVREKCKGSSGGSSWKVYREFRRELLESSGGFHEGVGGKFSGVQWK